MRIGNRKTTPKVKGGSVLRKNNHKHTSNYWNTHQGHIVIDAEKSGKAYKHFLKKKDIIRFLEIIPNWDEVSIELNAIVLAYGNSSWFGCYDELGVISISAWEREKDVLFDKAFYEEHKALFDRLGIQATDQVEGVFCEFNEDQIKGFQLLHILLHEIGHHVDRMKTKSKRECARGEQFAEDFAFKFEKEIWDEYQNVFNVVF